jgi:hypothetical protein
MCVPKTVKNGINSNLGTSAVSRTLACGKKSARDEAFIMLATFKKFDELSTEGFSVGEEDAVQV